MDPQILDLVDRINSLAREVSTLSAQVAWLTSLMNMLIGANITGGVIGGGVLVWVVRNHKNKDG